MAPKVSGQAPRAALRNTDTESSILMYDEWAGPKDSWEAPPVHAAIYGSLVYLSFVALWAYQALLAAQAYYAIHFPKSNLAFWGVAAVGVAMFLTQALHVALNIDGRFGPNERVIPGLLGFIFVAVLVTTWRQAASVVVAFALVGVFTSVTQSPLYGLAGAFGAAPFLQAMSIGNGLAGVAAVAVESAIRASVVHSSLTHEGALLLSFVIFMGVLILLTCVALGVYVHLVRMPAVQLAIADAGPIPGGPKPPSPMALLPHTWQPLLTVFLTLFVSLLVWPGLPCSVPPTGWFARHAEWYCAPGVIAAYNVADLLGRQLAAVPALDSRAAPHGLGLAALRFLFIPVLRLLSNSWAILAVVVLVGLTNGLVATLALVNGPQVFGAAADRRLTAAMLTTAMFGGIAGGSILAAVFFAP